MEEKRLGGVRLPYSPDEPSDGLHDLPPAFSAMQNHGTAKLDRQGKLSLEYFAHCG